MASTCDLVTCNLSRIHLRTRGGHQLDLFVLLMSEMMTMSKMVSTMSASTMQQMYHCGYTPVWGVQACGAPSTHPVLCPHLLLLDGCGLRLEAAGHLVQVF